MFACHSRRACPRGCRRGASAGIQSFQEGLDPPVKPEDDKYRLYGQTLVGHNLDRGKPFEALSLREKTLGEEHRKLEESRKLIEQEVREKLKLFIRDILVSGEEVHQ